MAMATVGALGMLLITVLSLGFLRRHLAYETWFFIHLLVYAALALAFAHEIFLGSDLAFDPPGPCLLDCGQHHRPTDGVAQSIGERRSGRSRVR